MCSHLILFKLMFQPERRCLTIPATALRGTCWSRQMLPREGWILPQSVQWCPLMWPETSKPIHIAAWMKSIWRHENERSAFSGVFSEVSEVILFKLRFWTCLWMTGDSFYSLLSTPAAGQSNPATLYAKLPVGGLNMLIKTVKLILTLSFKFLWCLF